MNWNLIRYTTLCAIAGATMTLMVGFFAMGDMRGVLVTACTLAATSAGVVLSGVNL